MYNENMKYCTSNIKELYGNITDKRSFIIKIAEHFNRTPRSVSNHWFSGFFSVPNDKQEAVKAFMQDYINNQ